MFIEEKLISMFQGVAVRSPLEYKN